MASVRASLTRLCAIASPAVACGSKRVVGSSAKRLFCVRSFKSHSLCRPVQRMSGGDQPMNICGGPTEADMAAEFSPIVQQVVCKAADVPPGSKKEVQVQGRKLVIINDNGRFFCLNGICSHYNFPLVKGIYYNGKLRCALHGACFDVRTGDIEDYPAFDSLHTYQIEQVGDDLVIKTTERHLESDRRTRKSAKYTLSSEKPVVVVGAGIAGQSVVENLRFAGCTAPITLVTKEPLPPYDRVKLSKNPSVKEEDIRLRKDDYYTENNIDVVLNALVTRVDAVNREVTLSGGRTLPYSKCVLALGGRVRKLQCKGGDLNGVYTLRVPSEANTIAQEAKDKDVVCIGASFIGMETSSALKATAASVTVICATEEPVPAFGLDIGKAIRKYFESKGVRIICKTLVTQLEGDEDRRVKEVVLDSGERIPAAMVVVGIGVDPDTAFVKSGTIQMDDRGFIKVNERFETNDPDVYAIGDAVMAPLPFWGKDAVNIQHFQVAQRHGQLAAWSMMGKPQTGKLIPFFWTLYFSEKGPRIAGFPEGHDSTYVRGDLEGFNSFVKYYFINNTVIAVASAGPAPLAVQFKALCDQGIRITREDVEKNTTDDWQHLLK